MNERCLVTGSHGFLGAHLVVSLEHQGHTVFKGDREGNCPPNIDIIYDLASFGNLYDQQDPLEINRANVERLYHLLENAQGYKSFIVTSSNSVKLPVLSQYAETKLKAEFMAESYRNTGLPISVVRPFTVVGVNEPKQHLIPALIRSCLYGEEIPFVPNPVHDFIAVEDVVEAYITVAEKGTDFLYEAGRGDSYSNAEIKQMVEQVTGRQAHVKIVDSMRPYDTDKWQADNQSLLDLGWRPRVSIWQTITEMVEHERT